MILAAHEVSEVRDEKSALTKNASQPVPEEVPLTLLQDLPISNLELADNVPKLFLTDAASAGNAVRALSLEDSRQVSVGSDRIWLADDCILIATGNPLDSMETAELGRLTYCLGALNLLEQSLNDSWKSLNRDTRFTHQSNPKAVKQWPHIMERTEWAATNRIVIARLWPIIEHIESESQSKLARKFAAIMRCTARIETLSDQLEVFEDTYELANDRISEFSYFRREWELELWIILLLVLELICMGYEPVLSLIKH